MPRFITTVLCLLALLAVRPSFAADEITAEPDTIAPGQTVTLHWLFTGKKVVVTGGRFLKPTVVTGRTSLTDQPHKTTRYTFDVWYKAPAQTHGKTMEQPLHARYSVVVTVEAVPTFTSFNHPNGWQIRYPVGWRHDLVKTQLGELVYFQPEADSLERMAVATMHGICKTCVDLMDRVQADIPAHYEEMTILSKEDITFEGVPAQLTLFTGRDESHKEILSQSMVLAFVEGDQAYVVTVRTKAANFKTRRLFLEKMLKSLHFTRKAPLSGRELSALH